MVAYEACILVGVGMLRAGHLGDSQRGVMGHADDKLVIPAFSDQQYGVLGVGEDGLDAHLVLG